MTRIAFERVLAIRTGRVSGWLLAATLSHAALAFALSRNATAAPPLPPAPVEVDLLPEPPPKELPAPTPAAPSESAPAPATPAPGSPAPPPAPAKAGAIAAKDDAPVAKGEEPVSFVTDPNGTEYGIGVVAKGGTASVGLPGAALPTTAAPTPTAPPAPPKPTVEVPVLNLSRKPLLEVPEACKGYFFTAADDDRALVTLRVIVRASGAVQSATVVAEDPSGQGFGAAARTCLLARTFTPGLDEVGRPAMAQTTVNVRFSR